MSFCHYWYKHARSQGQGDLLLGAGLTINYAKKSSSEIMLTLHLYARSFRRFASRKKIFARSFFFSILIYNVLFMIFFFNRFCKNLETQLPFPSGSNELKKISRCDNVLEDCRSETRTTGICNVSFALWRFEIIRNKKCWLKWKKKSRVSCIKSLFVDYIIHWGND